MFNVTFGGLLTMKKLLTFAAATLAASFVSVAANAATLDFVAEAAGNERGVASGTVVNVGGVNVQLNSNFSPYFDDLSGGRPGGLGVCRVLDVNDQCDPAGDDSTDGDMGVNEWSEVVFVDGPFDIKGFSFHDGMHINLNNDNVGQILVTVNGGAAQLLTFAQVVAAAAADQFLNVTSIRFDYVDTEFYISAIVGDVPIPGAIPLLLSGLAGLGFASRRKKKTA